LTIFGPNNELARLAPQEMPGKSLSHLTVRWGGSSPLSLVLVPTLLLALQLG
jgi:hypothetical protein